MKYAAVLFDLDGTLLDTLADIGDSMNRTLAAFGMPTYPIDRYKTMVGDGVDILVKRAVPESRQDPETLSNVAKAYRDDYAQNWAVKSGPYPGITELLESLAQRKIRLAVLSNKPHEFTLQCVERFLSQVHFDEVVGAGRFPHKPDPTAAIHIARSLDLEPREFAYLGDTNTDMRTAVSAGMYPIGVTWGFRSRDELIASGAQFLADQPSDVLGLV